MTRFRKITLYIFVAGFFVTAPLVALYTAGFRLNDKKMKVERIGFFALTSVPAKARVFVDNILVGETPYANVSALPGEYSIRLEKPGYHTWQTTASISSGLATRYLDVALWKDRAPLLLAANQTSIAPNGTVYAGSVETADTVSATMSIGNAALRTICTLPKVAPLGPVRISWSADGTTALYTWSQQNTGALTVCIGGQDLSGYLLEPNQQLGTITAAEWNAWESPLLLLQTENGNFTFNTQSKKITKISDTSGPFITKASTAWLIVEEQGKTLLAETDLQTNSPQKTVELPAGGTFSVSAQDKYLVVTQQKTSKQIMFLPKNLERFAELPGTRVQASQNFLAAPSIYALGNTELVQYLPEKKELNTIARYTTPLVDFVLDTELPYIFLASRTRVFVIKNVRGEPVQEQELAVFDAITDIQVDRSGKNLLVSGVKENQTGIYQVSLRD